MNFIPFNKKAKAIGQQAKKIGLSACFTFATFAICDYNAKEGSGPYMGSRYVLLHSNKPPDQRNNRHPNEDAFIF